MFLLVRKMSLDKFLSGTPKKKKKKSTKSSKTSSSSSSADSSQPTISKKVEKVVKDIDTVKPATPTAMPEHEVSPAKISNPSPESEASDFDDAITIDEFKNKSKFELFQIIQELVHASPAYSRSKNLLAQLLTENKYDSSPEILAEQLEISYYEVVVLLAEIRDDFENN